MDELTEEGATAQVSFSREGDEALVISLGGELDVSNVDDARSAIDRALEDQPSSVVFELSELSFMDSSGIAALLSVAMRVEDVRLRNPSPIIRRVIQATGIADVLPSEP